MDRDERIINKLDEVQQDISVIKEHMAVYNEQLKYHIKRSDQADNAITVLAERVLPIEKHVLAVNWTVKVLATVGSIILFALSILSFLK